MWLIYALGGGWGHLTRAIALARIAQRDRPVRILTNSPYAPIAAAALPTLDLLQLDPDATADQTRTQVVRQIAISRPACLIVDTFPRGIGGELATLLPTLDTRKVLVHRDLNPRYVTEMRLREFVAAHFDLILVPGAGEGSQLGDLPRAVETGAWLVRSVEELPDSRKIRDILRLQPHERNCVLVCAAGNRDELRWYGEVVSAVRVRAPNVPVRVIAVECPPAIPQEHWVRYWPAMDLFGCAAVVIGGAGYNTVRECLACAVPLVARPWPRTYDRQDVRAGTAAGCGRLIIATEPDQAARAALAQLDDCPPRMPRFGNGAAEAVRHIIPPCVKL